MLKKNFENATFKKLKIAVFASGSGTNLQALLDTQQKGGIKDGEISLVLSSKADAFSLTRAEKAGVKTAVVIKKDYPSAEQFEQKILDVLSENNIDLIVLAGFMIIFSEKFTSGYENRIINVHPSLIPSFCGKNFYGLKVHEAALAYGVKVSGATVHFVNEICDGGQIIMQKAISVNKNETPESLQKRIMEKCEWVLLPKAVQLVCAQIKKGEI